jgi:hypothetical protein
MIMSTPWLENQQCKKKLLLPLFINLKDLNLLSHKRFERRFVGLVLFFSGKEPKALALLGPDKQKLLSTLSGEQNKLFLLLLWERLHKRSSSWSCSFPEKNQKR